MACWAPPGPTPVLLADTAVVIAAAGQVAGTDVNRFW